MRAWFLRFLAGSLALAFAASGVAAHYCSAAHHATGGVASPVVKGEAQRHAHDGNADAHKHDADAHKHHAQSHQEPDDQLSADVFAPPPMDEAACSKCCGICTLTSAVAPPALGQAIFKVSAVEFLVRAGLWSGAPLRVDPGIPKRIV